jgi:3-hexulose-6-phosphate synthase
MKLQLALDFTNKKDALNLCKKVSKHIDIIEIGTPLIKSEGIKVIKKFKKFKKPIVADLKTMDTGFLETELAFKAGADISTVCGGADLPTIKAAIKAAKKYRKKILVDTIGLKDIKKIIKLRPNYICIHTSIDSQNKGCSILNNIKKIGKIKTKLSVAGGINLKNIDKILEYKPEIIIVGSAITKSKNPEKIASVLYNTIKNVKINNKGNRKRT